MLIAHFFINRSGIQVLAELISQRKGHDEKHIRIVSLAANIVTIALLLLVGWLVATNLPGTDIGQWTIAP